MGLNTVAKIESAKVHELQNALQDIKTAMRKVGEIINTTKDLKIILHKTRFELELAKFLHKL